DEGGSREEDIGRRNAARRRRIRGRCRRRERLDGLQAAELQVPAADRGRPAVHRRPRRLRRQPRPGREARGRHAERVAEAAEAEQEDVREARGVRGRPDAGLRVGRGRNEAFGTALEQLFVEQYTKLGGKIGKDIKWNVDQTNYDSEAGQLVSGNPDGFVIIDFPETFQKFVPSLVRSGKWKASETLMTEALRNADELKKIGAPADGLRGTAATSEGAP